MAEPALVVDLGTYATTAAFVLDDFSTFLPRPGTGSGAWPGDLDPPTLFGGLRDAARRICLDPVERIVLAVAEALPDRQRDALIAAAEAAGFPEVELVGAATAAYLDARTQVRIPAGALVLVCDLGATWTTSLLRAGDGYAMLLGHEGSSGGRDLDAFLLDDLLTQTGPADAVRRDELAESLRALKHALADQNDEVLRLPASGYQLSQEWLARLAEPGLRWVVASCRSMLARAAAGFDATGREVSHAGPAVQVRPQATVADVGAVLLVGGAAHLRSAEPTLRAGLRRPVFTPNAPEFSVLRGAVAWFAGAGRRRVVAEHPQWRVERMAWDIPDGHARMAQWTVGEGQRYAHGAPVARIRTFDERTVELTAGPDGVLLGPLTRPGDVIGPTLVVSSKRRASCLSGDAPGRRQALTADGEWLLTPDHRCLVECATDASQVRLWSIPDGVVIGEFRPEIGAGEHRGRIFVNPGGRLSLVAWDALGRFTVFDVGHGRRITSFGDGGRPSHVFVNESSWRLTAEGEGGGSVGRYRRQVATVWDLNTGLRLERLADDWQRHLRGFQDRSAVDGFAERASSPDGRLRASAVRTPSGSPAIALRSAEGDREVFRTEHPPGVRARTAFSADGSLLLANWESDGRSQVDVWEL